MYAKSPLRYSLAWGNGFACYTDKRALKINEIFHLTSNQTCSLLHFMMCRKTIYHHYRLARTICYSYCGLDHGWDVGIDLSHLNGYKKDKLLLKKVPRDIPNNVQLVDILTIISKPYLQEVLLIWHPIFICF